MTKRISLSLAIAGVLQFGFSFQQTQAASSSIDSASYYFNLGKQDQDARKFASAWKYYEQSARLDAGNAQTQLAIADVCMKMNRMAPAVKALEAASKLTPSDYAIQWKLVQMYYNFGQFNKVIEMLPAVHANYSGTKDWAFMLGKSYYSVQNYGKALDALKLALKEDANNGEASYLIGRMMVKMENYKAALPYYERALELDHTQPGRMYELALVYATAMQFDASIKCFQKAIELGYKPQDDFYMNMAYTMADAHKTDEAINMMREMLVRRPQDLGLLGGLADVCYHSGRYKDAIEYWDRVLEMDKDNPRTIYQIGLAYIKMGKEKDGKQLCDQAISMDPALGVLKHARQMPG